MKKSILFYTILIAFVTYISVWFNTEPMEVHGNNRFELADGVINFALIDSIATPEGLSGFEYYVTVDDFGKTYLEKVVMTPGEDITSEKNRVNSQILNGIFRAIIEQRIKTRNGYVDKREFLSGGMSRSLSVDYANTETIRAKGFKARPEGYSTAISAVIETLESYN